MKQPKPSPANPALVSARKMQGLISQRRFADAFEAKAMEIGLRIGVSVRQIRRWESATPPWPSPDYQTVLEALFGCPLTMLGFVPLDVASGDRDENDPSRLFDDIPERLHRFTRLEVDSISIRSYEPQLVPGLLQSPNYVLAVVYKNRPTLALAAAYERQRLRLERSQLLLSRDLPASFVISEAALQRPIGGSATLAEQLDHLMGIVTRYEQVRIQVLPTSAPMVESAPLYLLEMLPGRSVAWIEGRPGSVLVTSPAGTADLEATFRRLQDAALDPAASLELIDRRRREASVAIEMSR